MPTYCLSDLSALSDAMGEAVAAASDAAIIAYLKDNKTLAKGFSLKKSNCPHFRKVISQNIRKQEKLDKESRDLIYQAGLGPRFLAVLSRDAISEHLDEFAVIFGRERLALALVLDHHKELQRLGRTLLEHQDAPELTVEAARDSLAKSMVDFLSVLLPICGAQSSPEDFNQPPEGRLPELERQLRQVERHNEDLRRLLGEERADSKRNADEVKQRLLRSSEERNQLKLDLAAIQEQAAMLRTGLESALVELETRVARGVDARMSSITSSWLKKAEAVGAEVCNPANRDLSARADSALARQQALDRHSGNRHQLETRRAALTAKVEQVRTARLHALNPLPELEQIEREMAAEIGRLQALLGDSSGTPLSPIARSLAARIGATSLGGEMNRIEDLIGELSNLGLAEGDVIQLHRLFSERIDRMVAEHCQTMAQVQPAAPILRLRLALARQQPVALVCDGHNIINSLPEFADFCRQGHAVARRALTSQITRMFDNCPTGMATVVYDGTDDNTVPVSNNVTEVYSGGAALEQHKADKRIVEHLNWKSFSKDGTPVYLVTDDHDLAQEGSEYGAQIIPLREFRCLLAM